MQASAMCVQSHAGEDEGALQTGLPISALCKMARAFFVLHALGVCAFSSRCAAVHVHNVLAELRAPRVLALFTLGAVPSMSHFDDTVSANPLLLRKSTPVLF